MITMPTETESSSPFGPTATLATEHATDAVRALIFGRELLPGEQIRQDSVSARLGLSRSPLREALRSLTAEGLVRYSPRQGYFVSRLSRGDLRQIYLMRDVLERELLIRVPVVEPSVVAHLNELNQEMAQLAEQGAITRMLAANRQFHDDILSLADMDMICRQVQALWGLSESYRANYLWAPEHRQRVIEEHTAMVEAIRVHDVSALVRIASQHRNASASALLALLPGDESDSGGRTVLR